MKIYNIGVYPPPIGGVSSHIKRLHEHLLGAGHDSIVIDLTATRKQSFGVEGRASLLALFFRRPPALVHFHIDYYLNIVFMCLLSFRHTVVYSLHDERFMRAIDALPRWRRRFVLRMLRRLDGIVTDNPVDHRFVTEELGIARAVMIPEYIPANSPSARDLTRLTPFREKFEYLLSSNAWRIAFHNNEDLYGIDLLIEMVEEVSRQRDVGLLFLLPGKAHEDYYAVVTERIERAGIGDRFIFLREPLEEASSLWSISDIVIRATNTDGNSLTIHEALQAGTPVIASDCLPRPAGTILFRNRDAAHLAAVVRETLANLAEHKRRIGSLTVENNAGTMTGWYCQLMGEDVLGPEE